MTLNNFTRKLHIHLGLLILLFIWLFSLSGLILNHGGWKFTSFWDEREEKIDQFNIPVELLNNDNSEKEIINFLNLTGEAQELKRTNEMLELRVYSPGFVNDLHIDLSDGLGSKKSLKYNVWGKLRTLHTFNGMNRQDLSKTPNWIITNVWRFAMDGIALALIIICISSWMMWYKIRKEYKIGIVVLLSSFLFAFYFIFWS